MIKQFVKPLLFQKGWSTLSSKYIAFLTLFLLFCTTGCGFQPLYGEENTFLIEDLSHIKINLIADREGQLYRNHLLPLLTPMGQPTKPLYTLTVNLTFSPLELAYLKDDTASRMQIQLTTSYILKDLKTGKVSTQSSFPVFVDYNIVTESDFSTVLAKETATERAIFLSVQQLRVQLADYFIRNRTPQASTPVPTKNQ